MPASWVFRDNASTTLTVAVSTTPTVGTSEAWTVTATSAFPSVATGLTQFAAVISPSLGVDTTPEIVLVTNTNDGTHLQVQRGYGGHIKTHAIGDILTLVLDTNWYTKIEDVAEELITVTTSTTTPTITVNNGTAVDWNIQLNVTALTLTLNNVAANVPYRFTMRIIQDATGSRTVTWPTSLAWAAASVPTLTHNANAKDILSFVTYDGGTTIYGNVIGLDMR